MNLVFTLIAEALIRGEEVEFPFGHLQRVERKRRAQRGWFLNKITTTYKNPWTVKLAVDEAGQKLIDEEEPAQGRGAAGVHPARPLALRIIVQNPPGAWCPTTPLHRDFVAKWLYWSGAVWPVSISGHFRSGK